MTLKTFLQQNMGIVYSQVASIDLFLYDPYDTPLRYAVKSPVAARMCAAACSIASGKDCRSLMIIFAFSISDERDDLVIFDRIESRVMAS